MEVEQKTLTSYPATSSGLLICLFFYALLHCNHRGTTIQTQTQSNHYAHFSHILGRTGAFCHKSFVDFENETGEGGGRTALHLNGSDVTRFQPRIGWPENAFAQRLVHRWER